MGNLVPRVEERKEGKTIPDLYVTVEGDKGLRAQLRMKEIGIWEDSERFRKGPVVSDGLWEGKVGGRYA